MYRLRPSLGGTLIQLYIFTLIQSGDDDVDDDGDDGDDDDRGKRTRTSQKNRKP